MELQGLSAICACLGSAEEDDTGKRVGYLKGDHCLENLKDLLRFLRRDNPQTRDVFKQVCKWKTVSKDLIPIIQYCSNDRDLVLNSVKVLVFLTMPIEPSSNDIPQQTEYLWGLKSAITSSDVVPVVMSLLEGPLDNLENESFTEDDWKLVQLVLTLFRNVLAIQDSSSLRMVGGSASQLLSLRDRFLELLFNENLMDLIIVITQNVGGSCGYFRQDNLLLLEIFYYIFMGQDPELIARAQGKNLKVDGDTKASIDSLESIIKEEKEKVKLSRKRNIRRHSQFSGTFTHLTIDGSKAVFKGYPSGSCNMPLAPHKVLRGTTKKIMWDHGRLFSAKDNIIELLHDFLNQFLSGGYNVLMQSISEDIEKKHHEIQNIDIILFFRVAQFVTSFQYYKFSTSEPITEPGTFQAFADQSTDNTLFKGDICGPIASSMNESMFLLVLSRWHFAYDGLKETKDFKFLSAAGSLMRIMIRMLDLVLKLLPEDSKEPQTARILLYKLFYDQTDQGMTQFLLRLLKSFDTHKQPKSDLSDLVETIHVILRLMENLQSRGILRVSKMPRIVKKKEPSKDKDLIRTENPANEACIEDPTVLGNTEDSSNVGTMETEGLADAAQICNENINSSIQDDEPNGCSDMGNAPSNLPDMENRKNSHVDNEISCGSDDSLSDDQQPAGTHEVDFKVSTFVSAFANHSIIKNLCWLLRFYKSNSSSTNFYIISILRKITDDLELSPMLYQLSLLTTFYDILVEQKSHPCDEHSNIVDFLNSLVRRMLRKMRKRPLLFVEVLFWKSRRECNNINAEYMLHQLGNMRKGCKGLENDSENGEVGLSQTSRWAPRSIADALGEDEADVVISHHEGYQKRASATEDGIERISKRKKRLVLTDELEERIKELYEKYKDEDNCYRLIAGSLDPDGQISAAQVFNKLKQLGFKVAPRRRIRKVGRPDSDVPEQSGERRVVGQESDFHDSLDAEGGLPKQSSSSRKRRRAFSKDQEEMIKALFEQFKGQKGCNRKIAEAMAGDGSFTPAQVSRKLKQLGLHVSRGKKSEVDVHLKDEDQNESSTTSGSYSDDETLLSMRNRGQSRNGNRELPIQDTEGESSSDSDDEPIGSLLKDNKSKDGGMELLERIVEHELSTDPDDDRLGSIFKKKRSVSSRLSKLKAISNGRKIADDDLGIGDSEDVPERNESIKLVEMDMNMDNSRDDVSFNRIGQEIVSVNEVAGTDIDSKDPPDDFGNQEIEDEDAIAVPIDDEASGASTTNAINRRRLRMVIDSVDDV